MLRYKTLV